MIALTIEEETEIKQLLNGLILTEVYSEKREILRHIREMLFKKAQPDNTESKPLS